MSFLRLDDLIGKLLDRIAENPVRWSLTMFAIAYLVGGTLYALIEDDDLVDGLWWAYISMMTVGYGDFSPESFLVRGIAYLVILLGWASLLVMGSALAGRITERRITQHAAAATAELDDDFAAIRQRAQEHHDFLCAELDRLSAVTSDPRVIEALREVHNGR